ncbi:Sas10/Utp3/C1D-like protein [Ophiocordyceps camponoti-floridani]|uniref:Sas10/Utp3/C1D-like protein n=1 Tax=Ophiocordyceps camponoti-floridani TaxID=2030778 RepID=A0A8H4QBE5_9HYPO|nr:Sas10/Utp3/C1D-like protein [Ophiocordyceps camponoti-floridani]
MTTLSALLGSLAQSLSLAQEGTPTIAAIEHPKDGISLLDVKNELLLSYLQNLVFLILLKLRNTKAAGDGSDQAVGIDDSVRAKLVELRLYLEKGARPLEEKLKFSIERFLRTAEDAQREEQSKSRDDESVISDESGSNSGTGSDEAEVEARPIRRQAPAAPRPGALIDDVTAQSVGRDDDGGLSGIYRPPKRDRHLMETTRPREKADRRPNKSHTMEEFVHSELSMAPMAEPSIGTTIIQGGRKMKTAQERKDEAERRDYEEMNLVRLPKPSKKERAKKNKEAGSSGRMQFGGEDWRELGEGVDRIDRLTKRKGQAGGSVRALLDRSRKRGLDATDGHAEIGERYQKKVKMLDSGRRKGKKR